MPGGTQMATKTWLDRKHEAITLDSDLEVAAELLVPDLTSQLAVHLEPGETPPDLELFVRLLRRQLGARRRQLETDSMAHAAARRRAVQSRKRRSDAARRLHKLLVALRANLDANMGAAAAAEVLEMGNKLWRQPLELLAMGESVVARLKSRQVPLPSLLDPVLEFAAETWASRLEPAVAELAAVLRGVPGRRDDALWERSPRQRSRKEFDHTVTATKHTLEALAELTGRRFSKAAGRRARRRAQPTPGSPAPPALVQDPAPPPARPRRRPSRVVA